MHMAVFFTACLFSVLFLSRCGHTGLFHSGLFPDSFSI